MAVTVWVGSGPCVLLHGGVWPRSSRGRAEYLRLRGLLILPRRGSVCWGHSLPTHGSTSLCTVSCPASEESCCTNPAQRVVIQELHCSTLHQLSREHLPAAPRVTALRALTSSFPSPGTGALRKGAAPYNHLQQVVNTAGGFCLFFCVFVFKLGYKYSDEFLMQMQNSDLKQQRLDLFSKFCEFSDGFLSTSTTNDFLNSFYSACGLFFWSVMGIDYFLHFFVY